MHFHDSQEVSSILLAFFYVGLSSGGLACLDCDENIAEHPLSLLGILSLNSIRHCCGELCSVRGLVALNDLDEKSWDSCAGGQDST